MPHPTHKPLHLALALGLAAAGLLASGAAAAQSDAERVYQQERDACLQGRTGQDQATCLREAGAALQAARRQQLTTAPNEEDNRSARCARLPNDQREACMARVDGRGTVSGSVRAGGILREYTERIPATSP